MTLAPEPQRSEILSALRDPAQPPYAQVATVDGTAPKVRTVLLYVLDDLETLAFCTNTLSKKWPQLQANPELAGCFLHAGRMTQYRWEGRTELAVLETHRDLVARMWKGLHRSLRAFVWEDYRRTVLEREPDFDPDEPCPTEAVVLCRPRRWDIFTLEARDFHASKRTVLERATDGWTSVEAPIQRGV